MSKRLNELEETDKNNKSIKHSLRVYSSYRNKNNSHVIFRYLKVDLSGVPTFEGFAISFPYFNALNLKDFVHLYNNNKLHYTIDIFNKFLYKLQ